MVLSAAVMLSAGNVTTLYGAENDVVKKIAGFDELDEGIAVQILEIGADESDIRFLASLWVDWVLEEDETADENHEDTGRIGQQNPVQIKECISGKIKQRLHCRRNGRSA